MKKDKRISLEEHLETANNMAFVVHHMNLIFGIIEKHYPMSHKLFVEVQKLRGRLSELRSLLDNEYHSVIDDETWEKYRNIYHQLGARYFELQRMQNREESA